ncbi:hypothetical protein GGF32_000004 [Allomyces javanicus]|nr:hypothetical protein GGF32_000004 [Allomyces javanicus]
MAAAGQLRASGYLKRIKTELDLLATDAPDGVQCRPRAHDTDSLDTSGLWLDAVITGPQNTPYAGGSFHVECCLARQYPLCPPHIRFVTKVFHPNIDQNGRICVDILKEGSDAGRWSAAKNLRMALATVRMLLAEPNPDDPLDAEIAGIYRSHRTRFVATARQWTEKYAMGDENGLAVLDGDVPTSLPGGADPAKTAASNATSTPSASPSTSVPSSSSSSSAPVSSIKTAPPPSSSSSSSSPSGSVAVDPKPASSSATPATAPAPPPPSAPPSSSLFGRGPSTASGGGLFGARRSGGGLFGAALPSSSPAIAAGATPLFGRSAAAPTAATASSSRAAPAAPAPAATTIPIPAATRSKPALTRAGAKPVAATPATRPSLVVRAPPVPVPAPAVVPATAAATGPVRPPTPTPASAPAPAPKPALRVSGAKRAASPPPRPGARPAKKPTLDTAVVAPPPPAKSARTPAPAVAPPSTSPTATAPAVVAPPPSSSSSQLPLPSTAGAAPGPRVPAPAPSLFGRPVLGAAAPRPGGGLFGAPRGSLFAPRPPGSAPLFGAARPGLLPGGNAGSTPRAPGTGLFGSANARPAGSLFGRKT